MLWDEQLSPSSMVSLVTAKYLKNSFVKIKQFIEVYFIRIFHQEYGFYGKLVISLDLLGKYIYDNIWIN